MQCKFNFEILHSFNRWMNLTSEGKLDFPDSVYEKLKNIKCDSQAKKI